MSLIDAPAGTIGYTLTSRSTWNSSSIGPSVLKRGVDGGLDTALVAHAHAGDAIGGGERHEVRTHHRRRGIAAVMEQLLPLAHHAQVAVVDDDRS